MITIQWRTADAPALVHTVNFRAKDLLKVFHCGWRAVSHTIELDPEYQRKSQPGMDE